MSMDTLYWLSLLFVSAVWLWLAYRRQVIQMMVTRQRLPDELTKIA